MKSAGVIAKDLGNNKFDVKSGCTSGTLNLRTGTITGDTDCWNEADFDGLKQSYAEETLVAELRRQGASVQSRSIDNEGNIVIMYQTTG
jgi:hypothetical protein